MYKGNIGKIIIDTNSFILCFFYFIFFCILIHFISSRSLSAPRFQEQRIDADPARVSVGPPPTGLGFPSARRRPFGRHHGGDPKRRAASGSPPGPLFAAENARRRPFGPHHGGGAEGGQWVGPRADARRACGSRRHSAGGHHRAGGLAIVGGEGEAPRSEGSTRRPPALLRAERRRMVSGGEHGKCAGRHCRIQ